MAENISLPVIETVKIAWSHVKGAKGAIWSILGFVALMQGLIAVLSYMTQSMGGGALFVIVIFQIIVTVIQLILAWGLLYVGIQRALDMPLRVGMVRYVFDGGLFFKMIGFYILQIAVLLPAVLLFFSPVILTQFFADSLLVDSISAVLCVIAVVLAIYLVFRMYTAKGIIISKKVNPLRGIEESFNATKSNVWRLLALTLINVAIIIVSVIPLGIGLIWSVPYALISYGVVYKKLVSSRQDF